LRGVRGMVAAHVRCWRLSASSFVIRSGALACFFFQAEDGIRDRNVTGVQTCALPICRPVAVHPRGHLQRYLDPVAWRFRLLHTRSEERRVGKECRCRWSRGPRKKKQEEARNAQQPRKRGSSRAAERQQAADASLTGMQ